VAVFAIISPWASASGTSQAQTHWICVCGRTAAARRRPYRGRVTETHSIHSATPSCLRELQSKRCASLRDSKRRQSMARQQVSPYRSGGLMERGFGGDPFLSLHREMNRLFDDVFRGTLDAPRTTGGEGGLMLPNVDVSESENEVRISAELPGVSEKDVEVTLNDDILTIRGEKRAERHEERENLYVSERSFGTFQRSMRLPFPVEPDQVKADFQNGVLTVTLPKGKAQERSRRIQIGSGAGEAGAAKTGRAPDQPERKSKPIG
jgi:HSP20 family protein